MLKVDSLHAAIECDRGDVAIETARERALAAEAAYRDSRDRLTDVMMVQPAGDESLC